MVSRGICCGFGALTLLGLVLLVFAQRDTISRLREANKDEIQELETMRAENLGLQHLKNQEAEIQQLRGNTRDLLRLRNEVRQLREQQKETEVLRAANTQLLQLLQGMTLSSNQQAMVAAVRRKGAILGIILRPAAALQGEDTKGAVVLAIDPNSPAAGTDLKPGDVIVGLDGRSIESAGEIQAEMLTRKPGETVTLDVIRTNSIVRIPVRARDWPQ